MLFASDLSEHDGGDLRDLPLIDRKRRLARLIGKAEHDVKEPAPLGSFPDRNWREFVASVVSRHVIACFGLARPGRQCSAVREHVNYNIN